MNRIIHGDCLDYMKDHRKFDAIIADPPYDLDEDQQNFFHAKFSLVCDGVIIIFSPPENQWTVLPDQYLFWMKAISTKNTSRNYSRFVEMIFVYGRNKWNTDRHWSQYTNVFTDLVDDSSLHPYRKPSSLIERLILNHTDVGDWILDPFAGSGVVHEMCKRHDRYSVSIEIDEEAHIFTLK